MKFPILQSSPTIKVALDLLGAHLCSKAEDGTLLMGKIVETEAYLGLQDPACHSYHGKKTERVRPFYLPAGHAYVYLIYGMHHCFNVVTGDENTPEAVLIRAVEPLAGQEVMQTRRKKQLALDLCSGPGKLAQAFGIGAHFNGHPLDQPPLWIQKPPVPVKERLLVSSRVGLPEKKASTQWPLRFSLENSFVSPAALRQPAFSEGPPGLREQLLHHLKGKEWSWPSGAQITPQ